jgi:hypothetical protein
MAEDATWTGFGASLANGAIDVPVMELLAGDALADATLEDRGTSDLAAIFAATTFGGGVEMNAPLYTAEHFPPLVFAQDLPAGAAKNQARILLEYELLVEAHLYLPGGASSRRNRATTRPAPPTEAINRSCRCSGSSPVTRRWRASSTTPTGTSSSPRPTT